MLNRQIKLSDLNPLVIAYIKIPVPIVKEGMGIGISFYGLAMAVANTERVDVSSTVGDAFKALHEGYVYTENDNYTNN